MKDKKKSADIKHKKSYEEEKKGMNPVTMNGDRNMGGPVKGLK